LKWGLCSFLLDVLTVRWLLRPAQGVQDYAGENAQYVGDDEQRGQDGAAYGQVACCGSHRTRPPDGSIVLIAAYISMEMGGEDDCASDLGPSEPGLIVSRKYRTYSNTMLTHVLGICL
jgi:hypothetical protein